MELIVTCNLLKLRQERDLSIRELAAASGVGRTQISNIEMGTHDTTIKNACKLACALNTNLGNLFSFKVENKEK